MEQPPRDAASIARRKALFLEALRRVFAPGDAAAAAGVSRSTVYRWREADEEFRRAWDDIIESHLDRLEQALLERGARPDKPDTIAAIFLLKGYRREKFADRQEVTGPGGQAIQIVLGSAPAAPGLYGSAQPVAPAGAAEGPKPAQERRRR